jgi:hypothetical protein
VRGAVERGILCSKFEAQAMSYRILRIRGRTESARRVRLESAQAWMAARGWKLVDYAESSRQALFEPEGEGSSAGGAWPPWRVPPGYWRGLLEEWTAPRRLAITLPILALLGSLFAFNSLHSRFDAREAAENADEQWWTVNADRVNVRERPAPEAPVVARLHRGQRVLIGRQKGDWVELTHPERGYLTKEFLKPPPARR